MQVVSGMAHVNCRNEKYPLLWSYKEGVLMGDVGHGN
jgi:hypothetical protein